MSPIIKADRRSAQDHTGQTGDAGQRAHSFDTLAAQASGYLERAEAEAAELLARAEGQAASLIAQAHAEAAQVRSAAREQGRRDASADIERMVDEGVADRMQQVLPAVDSIVVEARRAWQAWAADWRSEAIRLAVAIAGRIVRRQIDRHPTITLSLVEEALALAAGSPHLTLHLYPADEAALGTQVAALVARLRPLATAEVVADERIERGGCVVETQLGRIDLQASSQLARIEEELVP